MSLLPFAAALEDRVNPVVERCLANAQAVYQGGQPFGVVFDRKAADPYGTEEVEAVSYTASFCVANAPGLTRGGEIAIGGAAYRVVSDVQPDASGWVDLELFKVA